MTPKKPAPEPAEGLTSAEQQKEEIQRFLAAEKRRHQPKPPPNVERILDEASRKTGYRMVASAEATATATPDHPGPVAGEESKP